MDISSSSDNKPIHELAADLTVNICEAETELDNIVSHVKNLRDTIMYFKEVANTAHQSGDENRKEDILCFQMVIETVTAKLTTLGIELTDLRAEIDGNLNN